MKALKCRIKAWKSWKKHYIGFTWLYGILVFLGVIHSPTFSLVHHIIRYNQEGDHETYESSEM